MSPISIVPEVIATINDLSTFAPHTATSVFAIVTTASKGVVDTRTLITSEAQLISTFGPPVSEEGTTHYGILAGIHYLKYGRQLWVVRVADYNVAASRTINNAAGANVSLTVTAATTGSHGNNIRVITSAGSRQGYKMVIQYRIKSTSAWTTVETHDNLLLGTANASNEDYIETRLNGISNWISVTDTATQTTLEATTTKLSGGDDGASVSASDYVGVRSGLTVTGLQLYANKEDLAINMLAVPGETSSTVISAMATVAEARNDCIYLVDTPSGLSVTDAVDFINGDNTDDASYPNATLNDWRGVAYYPWVDYADGYSGSTITCPPCGFAAGIMALTDKERDPWFAPAGPNRGILRLADDIEYNMTDGEHEFAGPIVGGAGANNLNPIRNIDGVGIVIWSQITLQRKSSTLRDVNVVRMLLYAMKSISTAVKGLQFDPNDATLWRAIERVINPELRAIKGRRGIYDYRVVCEEIMEERSDLVDNKTVLAQIFLKPTRAAEVITLEFTPLSSGAEFDLFTEA